MGISDSFRRMLGGGDQGEPKEDKEARKKRVDSLREKMASRGRSTTGGSGGYSVQDPSGPNPSLGSGNYPAMRNNDEAASPYGSGGFQIPEPPQTYPKSPEPVPPAPVDPGDAGSATLAMAQHMDETINNWPQHYDAALRVVSAWPDQAGTWYCMGAMEMALTEAGMVVAFDFRQDSRARARLIVRVAMSMGQVSDVKVQPLQPGEHSGIDIFEQTHSANVRYNT